MGDPHISPIKTTHLSDIPTVGSSENIILSYSSKLYIFKKLRKRKKFRLSYYTVWALRHKLKQTPSTEYSSTEPNTRVENPVLYTSKTSVLFDIPDLSVIKNNTSLIRRRTFNGLAQNRTLTSLSIKEYENSTIIPPRYIILTNKPNKE